MFCHKCGFQLPDGSVFCASCGSPQQGEQRPEPAPEQVFSPPEEAAEPGKWYTGSLEPDMQSQDAQPAERQYAPPDQQYTPPEQQYAPPEQRYAPPEQRFAPQGQQYVPQSDIYASGPDGGGAATAKKSGLLLKIAIPVAAVVIVAAAVMYFVVLKSPTNVVGKALMNMSAEVLQRVDGTPLKAVKMLSDTLDDGNVTVNFFYEDTRSGDETSGSITLSSIMDEREFAISGDIDVYDGYWNEENFFEFEAFVNKDRVAVGSKQFDSNYYGFRYSTFSSDIRVFGDLVGLDRKTMEDLSNLVEVLSENLNTSAKVGELDEKYMNLLTNFYNDCEQTSEKVDMDIGGKPTKVTKLGISVTKDAIMGFLNGLYDLVEEDEDIRTLVGQISQYSYGTNYSSMLREFRSTISSFDKAYSDSGTIILTLYIGNKDRLVRLELDANLRFDGQRVRFNGSLDFGASATDRWVLRLDADDESIRINWDYRERTSRIENTITVDTGYDTYTLSSDWNPARGDFILSFEDDYGYGGEITGEFLENSRGFTLLFDNLMESYYSRNLTIEIIAESIANIKQINYINLDKWDEDLLDDLEDFFYYDVGFSGFGFGGYSSDMPAPSYSW